MKYLFLFMSFFIGFNLFAQDAEFIHTYEYGFGEVIKDLQQTDDGGYIAVGTQSITIGYSRIMLIKTDSLGEEEWHRFYGFPYNNSGKKVAITPEGDFLILASTSGNNPIAMMDNTYLIKTNPQGDTLWTRIFGGDTYPDVALDMEITEEGDYVIGGNLRSNHPEGDSDVNIIKLNPDGDVIFNKILNFPDNEAIKTMEIAQNGDILAGGLRLDSGNTIAPDIYVLRLDNQGDTIWTFELDWGNYEVVERLVETSDGNILITGNTSSFQQGVAYDVFFIMLTAEGEMLWLKLAGENIGDPTEGIRDLISVGNDEFVWLGRNINQGEIAIQLQKMDVEANVIWDRRYLPGSPSNQGLSIIQKMDGSFAIGGSLDENLDLGCSGCALILETTAEGLATPTKVVNEIAPSFSIFPNPNQGIFTIEIETILNQSVTIELHNTTGQLIFQQVNQLIYGKNNLNFSFTEIPKGSYFLTIKNNTGIIESQVLLIQ